jgi:hypothetical protein
VRVIQPFRHDKRLCACGCGRWFRPTETLGPSSTECYAGAAHAWRVLAQRLGIATAIPLDDAPRQRALPLNGHLASARPTRLPSAPASSASADALSVYGPMRPVLRTIERRGTAYRVALACGHEKSMGSLRAQSRCIRCLKEGRLT